MIQFQHKLVEERKKGRTCYLKEREGKGERERKGGEKREKIGIGGRLNGARIQNRHILNRKEEKND